MSSGVRQHMTQNNIAIAYA
nr:putative integron gene cassette protein [uncultured bacterium]